MITTSKYEENGFADIISGLVKVYNPQVVVELGTQQGASAVVIGKALKDGFLYTYDLFTATYNNPPYAKTHADYEKACDTLYLAGVDNKIQIFVDDALTVYKKYEEIDMLHIDLCNHYGNIEPLLIQWRYKVNKCMILEGGGYNKWQREHGFMPFTPLLSKHFVTDNYHVAIIKKNEDYALTILTRYLV